MIHTLVILISLSMAIQSTNIDYPWVNNYAVSDQIINRINPPPGYERSSKSFSDFAVWLRNLPLLPKGNSVKLYNGQLKSNQDAHFAILNLDVGIQDLQQCADACIRLRAEYLYSKKTFEQIHFNYTNGAKVAFSEWIKGQKPVPVSGGVKWQNAPENNSSYSSFKKYLNLIFTYAGTASLAKELTPTPCSEVKPGDILIKGGNPGHAVMVIDVVKNNNGKKQVLLAQSYMPAQQMHILKNPLNNSPWFDLEVGQQIITPEWIFERNQLKTW